MDCGRVGQVEGVLIAKGIMTETAWPDRWMSSVTEPQAWVRLYSGDTEKGTVTVGVTVLGPKAEPCRETVQEAVDALESIGAKCRVKPCEFEGHAGLFSTEILAEFLPQLAVKIGAKDLHHAVSFTAEQKKGQTNWSITLEERFPLGAPEETLPGTYFSIICRKDAYEVCRFTACKRIIDGGFITQIRTGTANSRKLLP